MTLRIDKASLHSWPPQIWCNEWAHNQYIQSSREGDPVWVPQLGSHSPRLTSYGAAIPSICQQ